MSYDFDIISNFLPFVNRFLKNKFIFSFFSKKPVEVQMPLAFFSPFCYNKYEGR